MIIYLILNFLFYQSLPHAVIIATQYTPAYYSRCCFKHALHGDAERQRRAVICERALYGQHAAYAISRRCNIAAEALQFGAIERRYFKAA